MIVVRCRPPLVVGLLACLGALCFEQPCRAVDAGAPLTIEMPADVPLGQWCSFKPRGHDGELAGILYDDVNPPCCGMPLGGIGTGCIDLDVRGAWGFCSLFGLLYAEKSFTGNRGNIYLAPLTRKTPDYEPVLGLAIDGQTWVLQPRALLDGGEIDACADPLFVARRHSVNIPPIRGTLSAKRIRYWGHYPVADVEIEPEAPSHDKPSPVSVALRAWAPFLPGDLNASTAPYFVVNVTLGNASARPVVGKLMFSFPGIAPPVHADTKPALPRNQTGPISSSDVKSKQTQPPADAWQGIQRTDGNCSYVVAVVGADQASFGGGLARNQEAWIAAGRGELPPPQEDQGGTSAAVPFELAPHENRTIEIVVAWHVHSIRGRKDHRYSPNYGRRFRDAAAVVDFAAPRRRSSLDRIARWQNAVYQDARLPDWLKDALINNLALIPESTYWVQAKPPLGEWCHDNAFFGMLESPRGCPQIECIPCTFYGNWPIVYFFPELARSQLAGYRHFIAADDQVPFMIGEWGPPDMASPRYDWQITLNGPCYVMLVDRLWQRTGDMQLLKEHWPSIKANLTMTMNLRPTEAGPISMPSDNRGMEWFEWGEWRGMVSHAGGVRLATLKIAKRMASAMGDDEFAAQCQRWFDAGSRCMEEKMWAGDYYLNFKEEETGKVSDAVMAYQLDGEWVARLHGVGAVFREDRVPVALNKIRETCTSHVVAGAASFASKDGQPLSPENKVAEYGSLAFFSPEAAILGMTYMQSGEREYGLEFVRRTWEQMLVKHRHPWDLPNMLLGHTGERHFGTDYYQNMVLWTMPAAIAGEDIAQSTHGSALVAQVLAASNGPRQGGDQ